MSKTKVLVIVGTTRQGRTGRKIADWYMSEAKKVAPTGMELELYDIADLDLPVFDQPASPMMHQYNDIQTQIAEKIGAADGFVFVTGEYNHGIPGSLKNFIDYINAEWHHKAVAYVAYGSSGGVRAIEHLIPVMAELRVASVSNSSEIVTITTPWEALDENGIPKPGYAHGSIQNQLKALGWWVDALQAGRAA